MTDKVDDKTLDPGKKIPEGQPDWTPAEERALGDGWHPEDEWEGDAADWVDAKQFNIKGELMGRITQLGRTVGKLESDNAKLGEMVAKHGEVTRKMTEAAYQKAVREMKVEKLEAVREGDAERVMELDDAMDEIKDARVAMDKVDETPAVDPKDITTWTPQQRAWVDFVNTTEWAQAPATHPAILKYADDLLTDAPNMPVGDFIGKLNEYGSRAKASSRVTPPGPDDSAGTGRKKVNSKGKFTKADLSPMELSIAEEFVEDKTIKSYDEYAQMLGKDNNLESQR